VQKMVPFLGHPVR